MGLRLPQRTEAATIERSGRAVDAGDQRVDVLRETNGGSFVAGFLGVKVVLDGGAAEQIMSESSNGHSEGLLFHRSLQR